MQMQLKTLAAAAAALVAAGAHAGITNSNQNNGNSSVLFVAMDTAATTSVVVNLGVNMTDFLQQASFVNTSGALSGAGASASWDLSANTYTANGSAVSGDYAWSTQFSNFLTSINGGAYTWGVIAADNVSGAVSSTNTVFNRNFLSTGTPTQANIDNTTNSTLASNMVANFQTFVSANSTLGTQASNAAGASVATAGQAFLNTVMKGTAGGALQWSYLSAVGATTNLFLSQQASNPVVYQLGASYGNDVLLTQGAATFTFDGTTLSYAVAPVPEPGTYALLLAGLATVGFVARRNRKG